MLLHRIFCLLERATDELPKWWVGGFFCLDLDASDFGEPVGPKALSLRRHREEYLFMYRHKGEVVTVSYIPPGHYRRAGVQYR
jgi:hypothetical protein